MGADPATAGLIASSIAGPTIAALFAPEGTELNSFADDKSYPNLDPRAMMSQNQDLLNSFMGTLMTRAHSGASLPNAYVQQPGAYTGGGLPMPIGLVASDPALKNPGLLRIPGISGVDVDPTPRDRTNPPRNPPDGPNDDGEYENGPFENEPAPRTVTPRGETSGPMRRSIFSEPGGGEYAQLVRGQDLLANDLGMGDDLDFGGEIDDLDQGFGAAALLLESLKGAGKTPASFAF